MVVTSENLDKDSCSLVLVPLLSSLHRDEGHTITHLSTVTSTDVRRQAGLLQPNPVTITEKTKSYQKKSENFPDLHIASLLVISWREKNLAYADFAFLPHHGHGWNGIVLVLYRSGTATRAVNSPSRNFTVAGKGRKRVLLLLNAPTSAFTIKNLLRQDTIVLLTKLNGRLNMVSR